MGAAELCSIVDSTSKNQTQNGGECRRHELIPKRKGPTNHIPVNRKPYVSMELLIKGGRIGRYSPEERKARIVRFNTNNIILNMTIFCLLVRTFWQKVVDRQEDRRFKRLFYLPHGHTSISSTNHHHRRQHANTQYYNHEFGGPKLSKESSTRINSTDDGDVSNGTMREYIRPMATWRNTIPYHDEVEQPAAVEGTPAD